MTVELTVQVGKVRGDSISRYHWKREIEQVGLNKMIWEAVYELIGFDCTYDVKSVRYGSDGIVWAKVSANADLELDYPWNE